jgi:hypothetical protein
MTKPPFCNDIRPKVQSFEGRKKKEQWKGTKNSVPPCNGKTGSLFCRARGKVCPSVLKVSTIDYMNVNVEQHGQLDHQDEGTDL